jgi:alpha-ketoglutarate-dependent taurine dioxygenase
MGIPDDTVWNYEEGLLKIASSSELQHVRFLQLGETLHQDSSIWTKAHTLASIGDLREELVSRKACSSLEAGQVALPSYLVRSLSSLDDKERLKLLELARARCLAYNAVLLAAKPGSIRLEAASRSVNDPQQDDVLIVSLLPQGEADETSTPSDSVISIETNGRYRCTDLSQVKDRSEYELILDASGAPSHYRAKASIWDWTDDGLDVTFEHLYPTGTMIRPSSSYAENTPSIKTLPMRKIRTLAHTFSPVVLRGFSETTDEEYFLAKGEEMGEIMTWDFGKICKVKDSGEVDKNANNVTTNEALPMHFDGVFKFADTVDPVSGEVKKVMTPPGYQYFTCLSTAPKGDGYTLFANSRLFFQSLPAPFTLERLEKTTWSMVNDGFWTAKQTELPLVEPHKETGAPCLRWHQPWTDTKYSKFYVEIEDDEAGEELNVVIEKLIYDYRICLRFEWEAGDLLISDNMSMMHTRTGFAGACEREMWRIHFD